MGHRNGEYKRSDESICRGVSSSGPVASATYELLYPFDLDVDYRILSETGICVTAPPQGLLASPAPCDAVTIGQTFRLERLAAGVFQIRAPLPINNCLIAIGPAVVISGSCGTPQGRIAMHYFDDDSSFQLQFQSTNQFLQAQGNGGFVTAGDGRSVPEQQFQIRSTADYARRLAGNRTVTPASVAFPVSYATTAGNASASRDFTFNWPATALRIQCTVSFAADGGYTGSTTLNITR